MGACMSSNNDGSAAVDGSVSQEPQWIQKRTKTKAFQGTGHRLGSAHDADAASEQRKQKQSQTRTRTRTRDDDSLPAPLVDASLSQTERDRQREARLAAAEWRLKNSGAKAPEKKKEARGQPLRGPNTQNTMRWTAS